MRQIVAGMQWDIYPARFNNSTAFRPERDAFWSATTGATDELRQIAARQFATLSIQAIPGVIAFDSVLRSETCCSLMGGTMKHTTQFRPGATRALCSDPIPKEGTRITIYTAGEFAHLARRKEKAHVMAVVDLDLFENAYRKGIERAEDFCPQVFGDLIGESQIISLKTLAAAIRSR